MYTQVKSATIIGADMLDNNMFCYMILVNVHRQQIVQIIILAAIFFCIILIELLLWHKYIFNSSLYVWNNILF